MSAMSPDLNTTLTLGRSGWVVTSPLRNGTGAFEPPRRYSPGENGIIASHTLDRSWFGQRADAANRETGSLPLTPRELEVIELVATGSTDQQIADALFIARRTVTSHLANIRCKLGVNNRTAAVVLVARSGLI